jgi:hypothetical protein
LFNAWPDHATTLLCLATGDGEQAGGAVVLQWSGSYDEGDDAPIFLKIERIPAEVAKLDAVCTIRPRDGAGEPAPYLAPTGRTIVAGSLMLHPTLGPCIVARQDPAIFISLETGRYVQDRQGAVWVRNWTLVLGDPALPDLVINYPDEG